jgi:D-alanyl-D-alanine carboxypeptidase
MEGLYNYGSETPNNPYDKGFAETAAFEWLSKHAHEYGFILRFPEDKTEITGYSYESWHYRYVGVEHAKKIHEEGITLEEYLVNGK